MEDKELIITKPEEINSGEVVELPAFSNGKPFVARLKSPSLLTLCANGAIPNELLTEAQEIYEGKDMQSGKIKQYSEVMIAVAKAVMVEPKYDDVAEFLNSRQLISIYNYSQAGVSALKPFREIEKLFENDDTGKSDKQAGKSDTKNK